MLIFLSIFSALSVAIASPAYSSYVMPYSTQRQLFPSSYISAYQFRAPLFVPLHQLPSNQYDSNINYKHNFNSDINEKPNAVYRISPVQQTYYATENTKQDDSQMTGYHLASMSPKDVSLNPPLSYNDYSDQTQQLVPSRSYRVSQFHTQDTLGRVAFGFQAPGQTRIEARDRTGRVRGTYSYVDPRGSLIKMDYWDDGTGFHVNGNLPNVAQRLPTYTPEVQAARDQHFEFYRRVLEANRVASSQMNKEPYPFKENKDVYQGPLDYPNQQDETYDNYDDTESNNANYKNWQRYGKTHFDDTVEIDNPEYMVRRKNYRQGKHHIEGHNEGDSSTIVEPEQEKYEELGETNKEDQAKNEQTNENEENTGHVLNKEDNQSESENSGKVQSFSYEFSYTAPIEVEKEEENGHENIEAKKTRIPEAEMHDAQVAPYQYHY